MGRACTDACVQLSRNSVWIEERLPPGYRTLIENELLSRTKVLVRLGVRAFGSLQVPIDTASQEML
mgnify:CR=1 FL=1